MRCKSPRATVAAIIALAAACGSKAPSVDLGPLYERGFVSQRIEGYRGVAGARVGIHLGRETLSVGAGCNAFSGAYRLEGDRLHIDRMAGTEEACEPAKHAQDDWLTDFITSSPRLAFDGRTLTLTGDDGARIELREAEPVPNLPLVGTRWVGMSHGDVTATMSASIHHDKAWLQLDPSGTVEIFTACQTGRGRFQVEQATLRFEGLHYDGAACAEPAHGKVSAALLSVLDGSALGFSIQGTMLELKQGRSLLVFEAPR